MRTQYCRQRSQSFKIKIITSHIHMHNLYTVLEMCEAYTSCLLTFSRCSKHVCTYMNYHSPKITLAKFKRTTKSGQNFNLPAELAWEGFPRETAADLAALCCRQDDYQLLSSFPLGSNRNDPQALLLHCVRNTLINLLNLFHIQKVF